MLKRTMKRAGKVCGDSQDLKSPGSNLVIWLVRYKDLSLNVEIVYHTESLMQMTNGRLNLPYHLPCIKYVQCL